MKSMSMTKTNKMCKPWLLKITYRHSRNQCTTVLLAAANSTSLYCYRSWVILENTKEYYFRDKSAIKPYLASQAN